MQVMPPPMYRQGELHPCPSSGVVSGCRFFFHPKRRAGGDLSSFFQQHPLLCWPFVERTAYRERLPWLGRGRGIQSRFSHYRSHSSVRLYTLPYSPSCSGCIRLFPPRLRLPHLHRASTLHRPGSISNVSATDITRGAVEGMTR